MKNFIVFVISLIVLILTRFACVSIGTDSDAVVMNLIFIWVFQLYFKQGE